MVTGQEKEKKNQKIFMMSCESFGIPAPITEYKFLDNRKFRFDFAWIDKKVAVEIEGGIWIKGRHTRGTGYKSDMEKYNLAALNDWFVFRFSTDQINKIATYEIIKSKLEKTK